MRKNLIIILLGFTLITNNVYAGIPTVDGTSIAQDISNFIQRQMQSLKDYALKAKEYALQAQQYIQEKTKGINDVISKANEGVNWLAEQELKLRSDLQEMVDGVVDPVTGAITEMKLQEFTAKLRDGYKQYEKLTNSLNKSENAYNEVRSALSSLQDNPKNIKTLKKYKDLFKRDGIESYSSDCMYRGYELKSCALKWGNRIAFAEGLAQVDNNLQSIEAVSKHGLVQIASKESTIRGAISQFTGGLLGKTVNVEKKGTTEKQQLEANNVIASAEVAMQEQAIIAKQVEHDYKKREEEYLAMEKAERKFIEAAIAADFKEAQFKEHSKFFEEKRNKMIQELKKK